MLMQVVVFLVMMMFAGVFWGYIEGFLFWFLGTCLLRWCTVCIYRQMSRKTAVFWNVKICGIARDGSTLQYTVSINLCFQ
jgi:hypothetical protein